MIKKIENKTTIVNKVLECVSVVVKDTKGNLFFVLEKEKKAWKKPGQWSVMIETIENTDDTLEAVIKRGLEEELGISSNSGEKIFSKDLIINVYIKDTEKNKVYFSRVYLYEAVLTKEQTEIAKNFTNGEIGQVKIISMEEFLKGNLQPLRPGTIESVLGLTNTLYIQDGEYFKFTI